MDMGDKLMGDPAGIFKQSERTLTQASPDGLILLDLDSGEYFALDEVSSRIWELADGQHSILEIVEALVAEYDAPKEAVREDVGDLLEDLLDAGLVIKIA